MRLARLQTVDGPCDVRVADDGAFIPVSDPFAAFAEGRLPTDAGGPVHGTLLAPCAPTLVVGIAQNGPSHPSPVQAWLKNPRTVVATETPVRLRRDAGTTVAEAEVAIVIGRDTEGLTIENAHEYVLGITAVNDLSSPDRATVDPRNFEPKSGRGYTPLGPVVDTSLSIDDDLPMTLRADGEVVAATSSAHLPMSLRACLAYLAHWTPLGPGDVVMTGAPFSQSPISAGQSVEVVIADLVLRTPTH